jgi:hypothetical protein
MSPWISAIVFSSLLIVCSCKDSVSGTSAQRTGSPSVPGQPAYEQQSLKHGSGSAHVTYLPNVHVVEQEEGIKAIKGISSDGESLVLDASDPKLASLKAGDVLVIKGYIARKILASEIQGPNILIITENAALTDAVQDGHITLSAPIRFGALQAEKSEPKPLGDWLDRLTPPVYAQSKADNVRNAIKQKGQDAYGNILNGVHGQEISGWTTDFYTTPADGHLDIHLKLTKSVGGFIATVTGEGNVSNFDMDSDIGVEHTKYEKINMGLKNLNGMMNFKWEVATDTPGAKTGDDRIKLPAAIKIPLYQYLDGLPLYLEISSALILKPALSGGKEYSRGAFRINFSGYQHFSGAKGNIDADGNVTGDIQFLESQNISALAPMGMVVAFAAPRIELSFGLSKIFPQDKMEMAAEKVDQLANFLAKKALSPDTYAKLTGAVGTNIISKSVKVVTSSDATAFFEMVTSAGMSNSGMSAIAPCTRHDIHLWGKVGVSAQLMGIGMGQTTKDIYKKDFTRIDPPGNRLCESVGT